MCVVRSVGAPLFCFTNAKGTSRRSTRCVCFRNFRKLFFFVLPLRVLSSSPSSNPVRGSLATVCCGILLIHNPPPPAFLFYVSQIYKVCPCVCVCDTRCQLTCHRFHVWPVAIVFASLFLSTFLATRFDPPLRRVYLNNNMEK